MIYHIVGSMLFIMAITDILWKKIPNVLVLTYMTAGIYILGFEFALRFFGCLLIFAFLYSIRFFGAGDVKMISLLIGFLGTYEGMYVIIISLIFAAVYAFIYMLITKQFFVRMSVFLNYCIIILKTGKIEKYVDFNSESKALIPVAPYFFTGFIFWRCLC